MKEGDNEKKRRRSEAQLVLGWLKMLSKTGPFTVKPGRARADLVTDIDFGDWLAQAKFAATLFKHPDPELFRGALELAITIKHKKFFIDLGKCLSGEIDPQLWDKRDLDIAEIVLSNPRMRAKDAVRELERRGHTGISEENFRNWKSKLVKAKREYDAFRSRKP
jgi:uncharacterized protein YaeQ